MAPWTSSTQLGLFSGLIFFASVAPERLCHLIVSVAVAFFFFFIGPCCCRSGAPPSEATAPPSWLSTAATFRPGSIFVCLPVVNAVVVLRTWCTHSGGRRRCKQDLL